MPPPPVPRAPRLRQNPFTASQEYRPPPRPAKGPHLPLHQQRPGPGPEGPLPPASLSGPRLGWGSGGHSPQPPPRLPSPAPERAERRVALSGRGGAERPELSLTMGRVPVLARAAGGDRLPREEAASWMRRGVRDALCPRQKVHENERALNTKIGASASSPVSGAKPTSFLPRRLHPEASGLSARPTADSQRPRNVPVPARTLCWCPAHSHADRGHPCPVPHSCTSWVTGLALPGGGSPLTGQACAHPGCISANPEPRCQPAGGSPPSGPHGSLRLSEVHAGRLLPLPCLPPDASLAEEGALASRRGAGVVWR